MLLGEEGYPLALAARLWDYLEWDPASLPADALRELLRPDDAPSRAEIAARAEAIRLGLDPTIEAPSWPGEWDPVDVEYARATRYGDGRATAIAEDTIGPGVGATVPAGSFTTKGRKDAQRRSA